MIKVTWRAVFPDGTILLNGVRFGVPDYGPPFFPILTGPAAVLKRCDICLTTPMK